MRLLELELENIRCYKSLKMNFEDLSIDRKFRPRLRTLILGNNGTGKSTILKAIALAMAGYDATAELLGGSPSDWVNNEEKVGHIHATVAFSSRTTKTITLNFSKSQINVLDFIENNEKQLKAFDNLASRTKHLQIGYGVSRAVSSGKSIEKSDNLFLDNLKSLFNEGSDLYSLQSWISDSLMQESKRSMSLVKETLKTLLPKAKLEKIDNSGNVYFKDRDTSVSLAQMSDGFQLMVNWIGDLLFRITETFSHTNPLKEEFILLIDEIALHLHPAWQRTVLQSIRHLFPNAQIIATTHSPFVAQQAGHSELFTLIRDYHPKNVDPKDHTNKLDDIQIFHFEDDPRKLLIHQIITSDVFGIPTDESVAFEQHKEKLRWQDQKESKNKLSAELRSTETNSIPTPEVKEDYEDLPESEILVDSSYRGSAGRSIFNSTKSKDPFTDLLNQIRDEETRKKP